MKNLIAIILFTAISLAATSQQGAIQLPATGQTTSYHAGDDGDLQSGIAWPEERYTDHEDGTATDKLTDLMWATEGNILATRNPDFDQDYIVGDGSVNWTTALDYINLLNTENYLGHNDWRLPNIKELSSLVDLERGDTALTLGHPYTNLQACYWSSTSAYNRGGAYCLSMFYWQLHSGSYWIPGEIDIIGKILRIDGYEDYRKMYVIPVRGNTVNGLVDLPQTFQHFELYPGDDKSLSMGAEWPQARLIDNGDSTVTDRLTGLMWTQKVYLQSSFPDFAPPFNDFSWEIALDFIAMLNDISYLGYSDWRLPNRTELLSLKNCGDKSWSLSMPKYHPFIFDDYVTSNIFSSSTVAWSTEYFYSVSFRYGYVLYEWPKNEPCVYNMNAWAVRDDNSPLPDGSVMGSIMAGSSPVPSVKMTLDGPVKTVIIGKPDGSYEFGNIPDGQYTITLEKDYYDFSPNPATVNISGQTLTLNFNATLNSFYGWMDLRENMPESASLNDVFAVGENVWLAGGIGIYYSSDGGETFQTHPLPEGGGPTRSIYMKNENEGYIVTTFGYILYSNDATHGNWSILHNTGKLLNSVHMPPTHDKGFACGDNGAILSFTHDDIFDMSMPDLTDNLNSIMFPVNSDEGWLCGPFTVRRFLNNSWNNLQIFQSDSKNAIFYVDNLTGYLAYWTDLGVGQISKATDGITYNGIFFTYATRGFFDIFFPTYEEGWAVGEYIIVHTSDEGANWDQQAVLMTEDKNLLAVYFTSPTSGYAVGSDQFMKFGPLSPEADIKENGQSFMYDVNIYPNPCHDKIQITGSKIQNNSTLNTQHSTLQIIDLCGKVVYEDGITNCEDGKTSVDVSHLPAGLYLVKLQTDEAVGVRKIIIQ